MRLLNAAIAVGVLPALSNLKEIVLWQKIKEGLRALFYFIERKFFRAIEHDQIPGKWVVANINGIPISDNELPICYEGPNGHMVDALGSGALYAFHFKEGAEKEANRLNERVIAGFEIDFGNTRWNRAKAVFNQSPVLQVVAGMLSAGFLFSVGFLIHQGITVWWK